MENTEKQKKAATFYLKQQGLPCSKKRIEQLIKYQGHNIIRMAIERGLESAN